MVMRMLDLHCHILPDIDDGASNISVSIEMAKRLAADGVSTVACTPHILPGVYHNHGSDIREKIVVLQRAINDAGIDLKLVPGSDAHMSPDFIPKLNNGSILTLADSRYVLVEPPHHVAPRRLEQFFFDILIAGYVPILTHPERLTWINLQYTSIQRLAAGGVWMQITAGSLTGDFGRSARYWGERMLEEGLVHILATDAHDVMKRPPNLFRGVEAAAKLIGEPAAMDLVVTRPRGIISDVPPKNLPSPSQFNAAPKSRRA